MSTKIDNEIFELAQMQTQKIIFLESLKTQYEVWSFMNEYMYTLFQKFQLLGFSERFILKKEDAVKVIDERIAFEKEQLQNIYKTVIV